MKLIFNIMESDFDLSKTEASYILVKNLFSYSDFISSIMESDLDLSKTVASYILVRNLFSYSDFISSIMESDIDLSKTVASYILVRNLFSYSELIAFPLCLQKYGGLDDGIGGLASPWTLSRILR